MRCFLAKALPAALALTTPLMAWKGLCLVSATLKPVMCVVSESMAPGFHRGDILILWNKTATIQAGEIPVVWFQGQPLPMVHRAVRVWHEDLNSDGRLAPVYVMPFGVTVAYD